MESVSSSEIPERKPDGWKSLRKWFMRGIGGVVFVIIGAWALYVLGPPKDGGPNDKTLPANKQIASIEFENARPFVDRAVLGDDQTGKYWQVYYFQVQIYNKSDESTIHVKHLKLTDLRQLEGGIFKRWVDAEPVFLEWDATKPTDIPPQDKVLVPFARMFPAELQRTTDRLLSGSVDTPQLRFTVSPGTWPRRMTSHVPPGTHRFRLTVYFENVPPAEAELELEWSGKHRDSVETTAQAVKIRRL